MPHPSHCTPLQFPPVISTPLFLFPHFLTVVPHPVTFSLHSVFLSFPSFPPHYHPASTIILPLISSPGSSLILHAPPMTIPPPIRSSSHLEMLFNVDQVLLNPSPPTPALPVFSCLCSTCKIIPSSCIVLQFITFYNYDFSFFLFICILFACHPVSLLLFFSSYPSPLPFLPHLL